jgi:glutamyl-Q tRNA(Asp) synthetase
MGECYRGRFAPSPTGGLHFGSLVAAVGSWLDARAASGEWLVRIEDIDELRTVPGAESKILRTLEGYGLVWDGDVVRQTERHGLYRDALDRLADRIFPCGCTRKEAGERYPGTCRAGLPAGREGRTIRLRVDSEPVGFRDRVQGAYTERLSETCGDFILRRADGLYAYQLAVVVDDAEQAVTDVVRGADLLDSTPRQIWLQRQLGYPELRYMHLPVALGENGEKLSKQTRAPEIPEAGDTELLHAAIAFLGQQPPPELLGSTVEELLHLAIGAWDAAQIPGVAGISSGVSLPTRGSKMGSE